MTERKILNKPDENWFYTCPYTKKKVKLDDSIFLGPVLPNLPKGSCFVCAKDAMPAFRESRKEFDKIEQNCNTCRNFKRLPHDKKHGFLKGECDKAEDHPMIYNRKGAVFWIHPNDWMGMDCYESRYA